MNRAEAPGTTRSAVAIFGLVTLGGMAALSWELIWQIKAALALGVSAFGTAVTLAATMAGMTVGSLVLGEVLRGRSLAHPLRLYGWIELFIGLWGLLMTPGFYALERVDSWLFSLSPAFAPSLHVLGIALVVGPAAFAMGASIPVFAAVAGRYRVSLAVVYGFNTGGAALGVLLFSFVVLPALGVLRTCASVAALNLAVFAIVRTMPTPGAAEERGAAPAPLRIPARISPALASLLVFGTGFVTFGLEVAWFRSLRAAFRATTESFAIILASVLIPLAIAAQLVPWLRRRGIGLGTVLAFAGAGILLATPLIERMDQLAVMRGWYVVQLLKWTALSIGILGPPILFLGMVLPWCLEEFGEPTPAARLYAINTLGAVLGSLLAAWALLPAAGFARTAWLLGLLVILLAVLAAAGRARFAIAAAGAVSLLVAVSQTSSLGRDRVQVQSNQFGIRNILAFEEGPDSTVSVVENARGGRMLVIDGFVAATELRGSSYMEWMGRLPMLLHPDPKRALVICFGTGQTANAVVEEGPEHLDVVDVSRAVLGMAPYFESNRGVLEDPRVDAIVMDGRAWVRRKEFRYDVVTLEPMAPFFAGVNALYSREFYELVSRKLTPDGVAAQWVPFHILPPFYAASVAATFQAVFPDAVLWLHPEDGTGILLGRRASADGALGRKWPGLAREGPPRKFDEAQIRGALRLGPEELARYAAIGEVITDDNQMLSISLMPMRYERYHGNRRMAGVNLERVARFSTPGEAQPKSGLLTPAAQIE